MLWYALWYYNVLLPLCLIFSPLINFTGYLSKMPIGEWGILPAVCCLREGIPWFFPPPINLTAISFLSFFSLFWNSINMGDIFNSKLEENIFLIHMYTCYTQMWVSHQKHLFHFPFWTSRIYKAEKKSCSTCSVSSIPRYAKQVTCPSLFRVKNFDPVFWRQYSFHKNI